MSSVREQVLARLQTVLGQAAPANVGVFRSLAVGMQRFANGGGAVVIRPRSAERVRQATQVDKVVFDVHINIYVRGDPWDSLADAIDTQMHVSLMQDLILQQLVSDVRRVAEEFEDLEADATAGLLTAAYRIIWLEAATDITQSA